MDCIYEVGTFERVTQVPGGSFFFGGGGAHVKIYVGILVQFFWFWNLTKSYFGGCLSFCHFFCLCKISDIFGGFDKIRAIILGHSVFVFKDYELNNQTCEWGVLWNEFSTGIIGVWIFRCSIFWGWNVESFQFFLYLKSALGRASLSKRCLFPLPPRESRFKCKLDCGFVKVTKKAPSLQMIQSVLKWDLWTQLLFKSLPFKTACQVNFVRWPVPFSLLIEFLFGFKGAA